MQILRLLGRHALLAPPPASIHFPAAMADAQVLARRPEHVRMFADVALKKPRGMDRWARLDRYGKALVHACTQAVGSQQRSTHLTGLAVASLNSCTETNAKFDQELIEKGPGRASPLLFPYTLPGSAASEAAMHLNLQGPYLVFAGAGSAALGAVMAAVDMIDVQPNTDMVVATADVLGTATWRDLPGSPHPSAPRLAEGAAAMWLGAAESGLRGPLVRMGGSLRGGASGPEALLAYIQQALEENNLSIGAVTRIINVTPQHSTKDWLNICAEHLRRGMEVLHLAWKVGDSGASLGLMGTLSALEDHGTSIVVSAEETTTTILLVEPNPENP